LLLPFWAVGLKTYTVLYGLQGLSKCQLVSWRAHKGRLSKIEKHLEKLKFNIGIYITIVECQIIDSNSGVWLCHHGIVI